MFIILEGPDGAGKTTFAGLLAREMWEMGRGTVLINPKRSPRDGVLIEYKQRLSFYVPAGGIELILDRCWYSDDVYGPHWRGYGLDQPVRSELDEWAHARGAVVARLDADDDVLAARLLARGDDDVSPDDVATFAREYREQGREWRLPMRVNPTVEQIIDLAIMRETQCTM
jgi:thymidylate kinase